MNTQSQIHYFLRNIRAVLAAHRKAHELFGPQLSTNLSMMNTIMPGEIGASRVLAELLDPKGKHDQGGILLDSFIKLFLPHVQNLGGSVTVELEAPTDKIYQSQRRIDIHIKSSNWVVGIENKPWANDQPDQVKDYLTQLKRETKRDYCLVYLSGTGVRPSETSISRAQLVAAYKSGHFVLVSYARLMEWLDHARSIARSERLRWFISDFQYFIRKNILHHGDSEMRTEVTNEILSSKDNMEAAWSIAGAIKAAKLQLWECLLVQLRNLVTDGGVEKYGNGEAYTGLTVFFDNRPAVSFEFQRGDFGDLIYGFCKAKGGESLAPIKEVDHPNLTESIGRGRSSDHWVWYSPYKPELDWNTVEPWQMIKDESLAKKMVENARCLASKVEQQFISDPSDLNRGHRTLT